MAIEQVLGATVGSGPAFLVHRLVAAAASTNATSVRAAPAKVFRVAGVNAAVTTRYLKLYNKTSAPTVGTDTPRLTIAIPPGAFAHEFSVHGLLLSAGFAYAITTGPLDSDATAVADSDIVGLYMLYV